MSTEQHSKPAEEDWRHGGAYQVTMNVTEKELEDKEKKLRESIQRNYGRIRDVEKELSELQLQLRMNVGPKKSALEMLRKKIEEQSSRVAAARSADTAAQEAAKFAKESLEAEERVKTQLCQELNVLVQASARSQLDKLEQLTERLETLNSGLMIADHESKASELQHTVESLRGAILATSGSSSDNGITVDVIPKTPSNENLEAEAARSRHVQLKPGRQRAAAKASAAIRPLQAVPPAAKEARDSQGAFRGFE